MVLNLVSSTLPCIRQPRPRAGRRMSYSNISCNTRRLNPPVQEHQYSAHTFNLNNLIPPSTSPSFSANFTPYHIPQPTLAGKKADKRVGCSKITPFVCFLPVRAKMQVNLAELPCLSPAKLRSKDSVNPRTVLSRVLPRYRHSL